MPELNRYDLVILGSGSTAFAAALRARELGKTAVMTEERTLGGTCVNRGCLPSKNLIEAAKLMFDARNPRYPGLSPVEMKLNFAELIQQKDELISAYREKKYKSLLGGGIDVERGHVAFVDEHTVSVGDKLLRGDAILIATGARPFIPPVGGLDDVPYLTSDMLTSGETAELRTLPRSLVIIGGGYIGLELGQMFQRFGAAVTIIERGPQLLARGYEPELGRFVAATLSEEGVAIMTSARVEAVERDGDEVIVSVSAGGKLKRVSGERLLVATGRTPNSDMIAIERSGVALGANGEIAVDEYLRTNVPHIFAAGDVIGRSQESQMATPVGSQDGGIVAQNALSGARRSVNHRVIPRAIFIDPPIAVVGMTEKEAIEAGHPCWCNAVPMSLVPRAGAIRDERGFIKIVADAETDEVLGVTMFGAAAAEVIHEPAMAMRFHATLHDFVDQLHVYPTMAEALKIIAISRYKDPSKLSCCAE